jgi:hypothetical protein
MKRRTVIPLLVVIVLGALAGIAIAGRGDAPDHDLIITDAEVAAASTDAPTTAPPTTAAAPTTQPPPVTEAETMLPETTLAETTTTIADASTTVVETTASAADPTTTAPVAASSTTAPATQTTVAPDSTGVDATTTTVFMLDRGAVRVMVANATARSGLASGTVDRLKAVGYTKAFAVDALAQRPDTLIIVNPGVELFGFQVGIDLGITEDKVYSKGPGSVSSDDSRADVYVVLGDDWPG